MPLLRQKISGEGRSHASYSVNYPDRNMAFKVFLLFVFILQNPYGRKTLRLQYLWNIVFCKVLKN